MKLSPGWDGKGSRWAQGGLTVGLRWVCRGATVGGAVVPSKTHGKPQLGVAQQITERLPMRPHAVLACSPPKLTFNIIGGYPCY